MFVCNHISTPKQQRCSCSQLSPCLLCGAEVQVGALATPQSQALQQDTKCVCISLNTRTVQAQCQQGGLTVL